jgi:ribosomal protein S10
MFFCITISTKEKTRLKTFLDFFSRINISTFKFFKQKPKKNVKKFITVLKSPHVNKTAQEQFEFKIFTSQILLFSTNPFLCFIIFKRLIKKRFPGVKIKLAYIFDKKKYNKTLFSFLNPDNVKLKKKIKKKDIKSYFCMFDSYGEIFLKNTFI